MVIRKVSISNEGGVPGIRGSERFLQLRRRNFDVGQVPEISQMRNNIEIRTRIFCRGSI